MCESSGEEKKRASNHHDIQDCYPKTSRDSIELIKALKFLLQNPQLWPVKNTLLQKDNNHLRHFVFVFEVFGDYKGEPWRPSILTNYRNVTKSCPIQRRKIGRRFSSVAWPTSTRRTTSLECRPTKSAIFAIQDPIKPSPEHCALSCTTMKKTSQFTVEQTLRRLRAEKTTSTKTRRRKSSTPLRETIRRWYRASSKNSSTWLLWRELTTNDVVLE